MAVFLRSHEMMVFRSLSSGSSWRSLKHEQRKYRKLLPVRGEESTAPEQPTTAEEKDESMLWSKMTHNMSLNANNLMHT